ncbi:Rv3654c family TadE-like protein [Streptomyces sp. M41]|uniref:Rv3654c family TadE-like protein n=1 Tax=Streptomyces sp. M41 TaxID=3059412 RepID=UPI00374CCD96
MRGEVGASRGPGGACRQGAVGGRDTGQGAPQGPTATLRSDEGSATVWSVAAIAVLCVVFGIVLALGKAVVTRHHAAGGADLAALAAADHWTQGGEVACARAERVARAQGARLVRCAVVGEIADVTAASGRGPFAAEVRARAGPAGSALPTGRSPAAAAGEDQPTGSPQSGVGTVGSTG